MASSPKSKPAAPAPEPETPPPAAPRAPDLPPGISEADVAAKIKESAGQLKRADAIRILTRHHARAS